MSGSAKPGVRATRVIASNGVTYGPSQSGAAWGTAPCPLAPRVIRTVHSALEAPSALREFFDSPGLTVADLDGQIWDRFGMSDLPRRALQAAREGLRQLRCPYVADAIPAGLPLSWVAALPLRKRTLNAVNTLIDGKGSDVPLANAISSSQLLELPAVGSTTLIDLLCVMESAELDSQIGQSALGQTPEFGRLPESSVPHDVREFATWAIAETNYSTLGDALRHVISEAPDEEVWLQLAEHPLQEIAAHTDHPYSVLSGWVDQLPERHLLIFELRVSAPDAPLTLRELADDLGVTRERIRQIEGRLEDQLDLFIRGLAGKPVRWRIDTVMRYIGVAAPRNRIESLLAPPDGAADYGPLLLKLAGPYESSHGWLALRSALDTDPTAAIREMTDEVGRIDFAAASGVLDDWGLDSSLHESWIARDGKTRKVNGLLVRWDGPIADKLAFALADFGKPASPNQLLAHIDEQRATTSARNALAEDGRFVRANRSEWALASWGLPEYSGIASSIGQILESTDEPMQIDEVVEIMRADFGVAEGSARAYCDAAMFVVEDGCVRLRRDQEPFQYGVVSVPKSPGVFALGEGRVGLLFEVDRDVLRGSGRSISSAAGAILDIGVNDRLSFDGPNGTSVVVTFPGTSFTGPSLGSTRALAEEVGAAPGDRMTVVLDRSAKSAGAVATDVTAFEAGWPLVARLTGIDPASGMDGLAAALHCNRGEVRAVLRARGDVSVIDALPARRTTPDLEEALAALDAVMRRDESA